MSDHCQISVNFVSNLSLLRLWDPFSDRKSFSAPLAGVISDEIDNQYRTSILARTPRTTVVFKVNPRGRVTVVSSFTGGADGPANSDSDRAPWPDADCTLRYRGSTYICRLGGEVRAGAGSTCTKTSATQFN
jgi:hypothetical protein